MQVVGGCVLFVWWLEGNGWVGWGRRTRIARAGRRHPPYSYQVVTPHHHPPSEHQQNPPIITARTAASVSAWAVFEKTKGWRSSSKYLFRVIRLEWNSLSWDIFSFWLVRGLSYPMAIIVSGGQRVTSVAGKKQHSYIVELDISGFSRCRAP